MVGLTSISRRRLTPPRVVTRETLFTVPVFRHSTDESLPVAITILNAATGRLSAMRAAPVATLLHCQVDVMILAHGSSIKIRELPPEISQRTHRVSRDTFDLQAQERDLIQRALERFKGNRREAAEALRISTVTLWRKMKQYGLSK
jgi:transcriptional regulator of acetoin/glycerol metabolism